MSARIEHVQVAIPAGSEATCDAFYVDLIGFRVLEKPPALAARGGRWYRLGAAEVHLGVDPDFRPARKAHPALVLSNYDEVTARLEAAGHALRPDAEAPGVTRCYVDDPVGNRLELIRGDTWPVRLARAWRRLLSPAPRAPESAWSGSAASRDEAA